MSTSMDTCHAKGFARLLVDVVPELEVHASRVPHFGALDPLATAKRTRWDYTLLSLRTLLQIKQLQPGLGLGTSSFKISYQGRDLSGLEIAQTWCLLGGYGHLFGTFATERGLLYALDSSPADEHLFEMQIPSQLRLSAMPVMRQRDLYKFFYVLAAWRISQWKPSSEKDTALKVLEVLLKLPDGAQWKRLQWAFRRARQIAYTHLHGQIGVEGANHPIDVERTVRELRPVSRIWFVSEEIEHRGAVLGFVDALDSYYAETFFSSPEANQHVLKHLSDFKAWWSRHASLSLADRISTLSTEPTDWPNSKSTPRAHFLRLHIPDGGTGWPAEVRRWLGSDEDVWQDANFLLSPSRRPDQFAIVDVFSGSDGREPSARLLDHVAAILAERNEALWSSNVASPAVRNGLWRSIADFGLKVFQLLLRPGLFCHLEPVQAKDGVGLALASRSLNSGCGRLLHFLQRLEDVDRHAELDAMRDYALQVGEGKGTWLAFLGRFRISDESSGKIVQEIDCVFGFFTSVGVEWHLMEHKGGGAGGMRGQLDEVANYLNVAVSPSSFVDVSRGRAALAAVQWPERASLPSAIVAKAAYELWERSGRPDGYDVEHWLSAERELRARSQVPH